MKYKKEKTRNVETRSVRAYYDRSRGSYCLILEDMDTQERVFTLPIYTNEPYRLEDPRVKDSTGRSQSERCKRQLCKAGRTPKDGWSTGDVV